MFCAYLKYKNSEGKTKSHRFSFFIQSNYFIIIQVLKSAEKRRGEAVKLKGNKTYRKT